MEAMVKGPYDFSKTPTDELGAIVSERNRNRRLIIASWGFPLLILIFDGVSKPTTLLIGIGVAGVVSCGLYALSYVAGLVGARGLDAAREYERRLTPVRERLKREDREKTGDSENPLTEEMKRVAPTLFPGGHDQILSAGRSISGMLDARVPPEAAGRIYASTKYLAHTAKDKSKQRLVDYIVRQGMGRISESEAGEIYDRFVAERGGSAGASQGSGRIDSSLSGRDVHLQGGSRAFRMDATMFAALLLGLRSTGWNGGTSLFTADGRMLKSLAGMHTIPEAEAKDMALRLLKITETRNLQAKDIALIEPLAVMAAEGSFSFYVD